MKSGVAGARARDKATVKVSIEVISWLKEDFEHEGWDRLVFDKEINRNSSIMDLLQQLAREYPKFNQKAFIDSKVNLLDYSAVILNGTFLSSLRNLDTELKEGDNIKLTPGFYGG